MQIDEERFQQLEKKVDQIWVYLRGDDLRPNGAEKRIQKNNNNITKLWVTVYGILTGIVAAVLFLLRWGTNLFT